MFKTYEPLTKSKHLELRFSPQPDFKFAARISAVKISISEFRKASFFYPIIFPLEGPCVPMVIFSLKKGQNLFVDDKGNWKPYSYIPACLRLYPFTLATFEGGEKAESVLCLDPEAEHFHSGMGEPLFSIDGGLTQFVQEKIVTPLTQYHNELITTATIFKTFEESGLIVPRPLEITLNGNKRPVDGFKSIDLNKLYALDDLKLAAIIRNGTMRLIYEHASSLSNFSNFLASVV